MVTEFCEAGNLEQKMTTTLAPRTIDEFVKQMTEGMRYLKKKSILHLDIKPANVLVNVYDSGHQNIYKLGDFGTTQLKSTFLKVMKKVGSIAYMCPEILREDSECRQKSYQADLWSTG